MSSFDGIFRGKKIAVLARFETSPTTSASLAMILYGEVWLGSDYWRAALFSGPDHEPSGDDARAPARLSIISFVFSLGM
jgi:hypothetical protein